MIRDIVLHLDHDQSNDPMRDHALSIAATLEAHVTGVAFAYEPELSANLMPNFPIEKLAERRAESEQMANETIARFNAAATRNRLSAEYRLVMEYEAGIAGTFARLARYSDLSIVTQSNPDGVNNDALIEASLFDAGRPLVVIPYIQEGVLELDRLVCCWDGSSAAARAINDALPLLAKASNVELLTVLDEKANGVQHEIDGVEMASHLARHKVKVDVKSVPAADLDLASVILSYAADCSASMIVMGSYGHPRLREAILGGTTSGILSSMTVPVFMSH
ncbi:universal stress protein [Bradyrhizobium sp.]|uniref:universal stress protein n=1 Tax=Bradyrhizobium sp. TaxID=376 RepID=UPI003C6A9ED6